MKKTKNGENYDFSPETVVKRRKFPVVNTVLLALLVAAQLVCLLVAIFYQPKPQDVIEDYTIYVRPLEDGSLDIEYRFTWTPLDKNEPLEWVEIGMANESFTILDGFSSNIRYVDRYTDDEGYCYVEVYFSRPYNSGETFEFSFKVNQKWMLCTDGNRVFYEFIPGWFNYTQVKHYSFNFHKYGDIDSYNGDSQDKEWLTWEGSLDYGYFRRMRVNYNSFDAPTVRYERFNGSGSYDGLASDKTAITVMMIFLMIIIGIGELFIVDSYVSYNRGRGFLRGYGHPIHVYGHSNPRYRSEAEKHSSRGGGRGGFGGGCACACACACAGGGRAGCSQKDTVKLKSRRT